MISPLTINKMIKKLLYTAVAALMLTGCDDTWKPQLDKEGQLSLSDMQLGVDDTEATVSRTDINVDVSNFTVQIKQGESVLNTWTYSQMPEIISLPTGDYTVYAYSHEVQKQEWNAPYYVGSKDFKINENTITNIGNVLCKLTNIRVTVTFTDDLRKHLGSDTKVTVVAGEDATLTYDQDTQDFGYFQAIDNSMTLAATFTGKIDGVDYEFTKTYTDVKGGTHYNIVFSVKTIDTTVPDEGGDITAGENASGISISTAITSVDSDITVNLDEEIINNPEFTPGQEDPETPSDPSNPNDPSVDPQPGSDNIIFTSTTLDLNGSTNSTSITPAVVNISAANGIANLEVTISGSLTENCDLSSVGLADYFDLAYPGNLEAGLKSLGFPTGEDVIGQTSIDFDITQFVPLLNIYGGVSTFVIKVTDQNGESNSATLIFDAD